MSHHFFDMDFSAERMTLTYTCKTCGHSHEFPHDEVVDRIVVCYGGVMETSEKIAFQGQDDYIDTERPV